MAKCKYKLMYDITFWPGSGQYHPITPQKAGWFVRNRGGRPGDLAKAKERACRRGSATIRLPHGPSIVIERKV